MPKPLYEDLVVAEIHVIRTKVLTDCGGDHQQLMRQVRERQQSSHRKIIAAPLATFSTEQTDAAEL